MGNKLKVGDTIKCATSEEMVDLMMTLAKEGIETDFLYEKDGEHGLWLEIVEVRKMDEKKVREAIEELKSVIRTYKDTIVYAKDFGVEGACEIFKEKIRIYKIAIEALEKQLPKKPKHIHANYGKHLWKKNADGSVNMEAFDGDINGYASECERCGSLAFYEELLEDEDCEVDEYYCLSCNCRVPKGENACKCGQLLKWEK